MPEPTIMSIAAVLAGRAATALATTALGGLYRYVKEQFSPEAQQVLEAAVEAPDDTERVEELGRELERAEQADPEFGRRLREQYEQADVEIHADNGSVVNQISGTVTGKVVQARDITGNISF
ncbi:hypothetical protein [Allokutzneria oryzae]|uniref:RHIM domain-containing protein n=1 Tax=Allokutzneria oryzae TaxID=1378989 RepID=A0ABV5ZZ66_9PSEU